MLTVIHAGAGCGTEIEAYLKAGAKRIILLEPNPNLQSHLELLAKQYQEVEHHPLALSDRNGEGSLTIFNLSAASSLCEPAGIQQLYPNLKAVKTVDVKVMAAADLQKNYSLNSEASNWLVLESNGEEKKVLQSLQDGNVLHVFDKVQVRCGENALYHGAGCHSEIQYLLELNGYKQASRDDRDPDQPFISYTLDKTKTQIEQLGTALAKARQMNSELQQQNRQLKAENEEIQQRQAQLEEELRKAEVQIELIKELFLSKEDAEQLETKERDA